MARVLSPFVYWAQSDSHVYLKVDIKDVKDPVVLIEEDYLEFNSAERYILLRDKFYKQENSSRWQDLLRDKLLKIKYSHRKILFCDGSFLAIDSVFSQIWDFC